MKVLLIDDHRIFLEGMKFVMESIDPMVDIRMASKLAEGLELLKDEPDLVFTDLVLPGLKGIDALKAVREAAPNIPTVVLAGSEAAGTVRAAIDHGASGYIFKSTDSVELSKALRVVLKGGVYLPATALSSEQFQVTAAPELTKRKKDVLRCLVRGLSNKEIARELFISDETVKSHVREIFEVLDVHTRTRAVYAVAILGIPLD